MGYNAPPPTQATIEMAHEWNEKICEVLGTLPVDGDWQHAEMRDDEIDWDLYPTWGFSITHHTLPSRDLLAIFGIPTHSKNCKCLEAPGIKLSIYVVDQDTQDQVPGCASVQIDHAENIETVLSVLGTTAILFDKRGVI